MLKEETEENNLQNIWTSHVLNELCAGNLIHTTSEFAYAAAVIDQTKGWNAQDVKELVSNS